MTQQEITTPEAATQAPEIEWKDLGLDSEILEVIAKAGFTRPTPVQAQAIPIAMEQHDLIASAQTGTGKTAAFVLPMVQAFRGRQGTFGIVLAPTREIAQQIHQTVEILGGPLGVRSIVLIGGVDYKVDAAAINSYPQIIVATPGRLCDHLDRGNLWLDYVEITVLDEADRMLDMGFSTQLNRIMEEVPKKRQTLLFSATFPASVQRFADKILHEPQRVNIGRPLSAATTVEQRAIRCDEGGKFRELMRIIRQERGSIMIFTRSKDGASRLWRSLHSTGIYDATYIHSDRLQSHREQALADFKSGKFRILVATDVAGRGIHVDGVAHVVNYDLPMEPEDYVHRIGRTGRAGQTGRSTTFVTPRDRGDLRQIEKLVGRELPSEFDSARARQQQQGGRGQGRPIPPVGAGAPAEGGADVEGTLGEGTEALEGAEGALSAESGAGTGEEPQFKPYTAGDPSQRRRRRRRRGGRGRNGDGGSPGAGSQSGAQRGSGGGSGEGFEAASGGGGDSASAHGADGARAEGGATSAGPGGAPGEGQPGGGRGKRRRRRRRGGRGRNGDGGGGNAGGGSGSSGGGGDAPQGGGGGTAFPV